MSNKTKLIIGLLFLAQIGIIAWSMSNNEANKSDFEKQLDSYLENSESVKILNFQAMKLTELPEDILQFQNVEVVNLSHNNFEEIPSILYELQNLKRLDMSYNQFNSLVLQQFENVTHLDFSQNNIQYVNGESYFESLRTIDLSYNQLFDFPYFQVDMDTVNLKYNELSNFKDIAANLPKTIQHLDLSNNQFRNFNNAQLIVNNCYSLDLSNNKSRYIDSFPSTLFSEHFITQKLFLNSCDFNSINTLPASQLRVLDLGNNNLTITDELVHQLKMNELNLEKQKLENIFLLNLSLKELNLVDVTIVGDFELMLPNLEIIHISDSFGLLSDLPDLPKLKTIYYHKESDVMIDDLQIKYPNANIIRKTSNN